MKPPTPVPPAGTRSITLSDGKAKAERKTKPNSGAQAEAKAGRNSEAQAKTKADRLSNARAEGMIDGHSKAKADRKANRNSKAKAEVKPGHPAADKQAADPRPYADLSPDRILDAVESIGLVTDGRLLALNSYENRVYQVGIEEGQPLIAKFYRPGRWSDAAILEEHTFTQQLAEREIPAVPPLVIGGHTLHHHGSYRFSLSPRRGGRTPELDHPEVLTWLGRFLGRIHALGETLPFQHRPSLDIASFGEEPRGYLLAQGWLPRELHDGYASVSAQALNAIRRLFDQAGEVRWLRLHGDCHPGNLLWTDAGPHFVDFDDCRMGPAIQDLWMLLSGNRDEMAAQLDLLLAGYQDFRDFDYRELHLIEALRTLRLMHYSAWLARRWEDPAFPLAFPWFNSPRYWEERIQELREQIAAMREALS